MSMIANEVMGPKSAFSMWHCKHNGIYSGNGSGSYQAGRDVWDAALRGDASAQIHVTAWLEFDVWPPGAQAKNTGRRGTQSAFTANHCRALAAFGEARPAEWVRARYADLSPGTDGEITWRIGRRTVRVTGARVGMLRLLIQLGRTGAPGPADPLLAGQPSIFTIRRAIARGRQADAMTEVPHVEAV